MTEKSQKYQTPAEKTEKLLNDIESDLTQNPEIGWQDLTETYRKIPTAQNKKGASRQ